MTPARASAPPPRTNDKDSGINELLESLPRSDRDDFLGDCDSVELGFGSSVYTTGESAPHAFFPVRGMYSVLSHSSGMPPVEVGIVGKEGMLGTHLVLGVAWSPFDVVVQGAGRAWRIRAAAFRRQLARDNGLDELMRRYACATLTQCASEAPCLRFHSITQRLARWLLLSHDRAASDQFRATHEFLASMLGVRRAGVTVAAGELQEAGLISYTRGVVSILEREHLEAECCSCYERQRASHSRIMRPRHARPRRR